MTTYWLQHGNIWRVQSTGSKAISIIDHSGLVTQAGHGFDGARKAVKIWTISASDVPDLLEVLQRQKELFREVSESAL